MDTNSILDFARANLGLVNPDEIKLLASYDHTRLWPVLVRCGGGRFTTPAQDVAHFVGIIEADGRDYVRDVSLVFG